MSESMYWCALKFAETNDLEQARVAGEYGERYWKSKGHEILRKIQPLILQVQAEAERRVVMNKARIIEELANIGLANPLDYLHPDGKPKQLHELTREQAAAVSQFEVTRGKNGKVTTTFKLHDKQRALELGGKHLGMFDSKLILQGRIEHEHRHKHETIDITKVPSNTLAQWETQLLEEAQRQGVTIDNNTGRPDE